MFRLLGDIRGKNVLCFGCGDDNSTVLLALKGAQVWAFDLSYEAIRLQVEMALANGLGDRIHPLVCAAEELPFPPQWFDVVFGSAILHHIPDHLARLPQQLARILKPGGFALFAEPVIRSSGLKWVLDRLPGHQEISPNERQLVDADLDQFAELFDVDLTPFCFLSRLDRFLLAGPLEMASPWKRAAIYALHAADYMVLRSAAQAQLAGVLVMKLALRATAEAQTPPMAEPAAKAVSAPQSLAA